MSPFWLAVCYLIAIVCWAFDALEINRIRKPFHWIALGLIFALLPLLWNAAQAAAH